MGAARVSPGQCWRPHALLQTVPLEPNVELARSCTQRA